MYMILVLTFLFDIFLFRIPEGSNSLQELFLFTAAREVHKICPKNTLEFFHRKLLHFIYILDFTQTLIQRGRWCRGGNLDNKEEQ